MIISISGDAGSGKTTVGKMLAEKLNFRFYSMGDMRGKMAEARGMTINELNLLGEKDPFTDKDVDNYQSELGRTEDDFVIDGRLSYHFISHSIKIYVSVDPEEGARRVFEHSRSDEKYASVEDAKKSLQVRAESDKKRYGQWYGIEDYTDYSNYNFIIDSTKRDSEEVVKAIFDYIKR